MDRERFAKAWNTWQGRLLVGFGVLLGVVELVDLVLRSRGVPVELVSQSARRVVFSGFTALAFFFGSMTTHWFVTWRRRTWEGTIANVLGLFFWAVFAAYIAASFLDPDPAYWPVVTQWLRYPPVAALVGAVLAYVCFPQRSRWFPGY
jgi:hypothetical protein